MWDSRCHQICLPIHNACTTPMSSQAFAVSFRWHRLLVLPVWVIYHNAWSMLWFPLWAMCDDNSSRRPNLNFRKASRKAHDKLTLSALLALYAGNPYWMIPTQRPTSAQLWMSYLFAAWSWCWPKFNFQAVLDAMTAMHNHFNFPSKPSEKFPDISRFGVTKESTVWCRCIMTLIF